MKIGKVSTINFLVKFIQSNVKETGNRYVILCMYVDNMLIVSSNDKMIKSTKNKLNSRFGMKDTRLADVIL